MDTANIDSQIHRMQVACGVKTDLALAKLLEVSPQSISGWRKRGKIPGRWLQYIVDNYKSSVDWILTGKEAKNGQNDDNAVGDRQEIGFLRQEISKLRDENRELRAENKRLIHENNDLNGQILEVRADPERQLMVSVIGLAECSLKGWELLRNSVMSASAPPDIHKGGKGFAVVAIGDSMVPAGIEPNFLIFCDPERDPLPGDIVYVEDTENHGTIKVYVGPTKVGNGDFIALQGWLPRDPTDPDTPQKPFTLEVAASKVKRVCTVVYIRR